MNYSIAKRKPEETALQKAINVWAQATTPQELVRAVDIERDKKRAALDFFEFTGGKELQIIAPPDVQQWHKELQTRGYKPKTIYTYLSHLSSFFEWLKKDPNLKVFLPVNPVRLVMPPAPKKYGSESASSLSDEEFSKLWQTIAVEAQKGDLLSLRDFAIFRFFAATGMRRAEILNLKGKDIEIVADGLLMKARVKGGDYLSRHLSDLEVREVLLEYLSAAGRSHVIGKDEPLWARCDPAKPHDDEQLSSHGFVKRMKIYANKAGLAHFHLHQLRHTFARIVAEESGSLVETQEALGHADIATTKVYVQRIAIKRDKFSQKIKERIKM